MRAISIPAFGLLALILLTHTTSGDIDPDIIAGLWLFDEADAGIARDYSGNKNDGSIKGAKRVPGKFGKALEFDGDDFVEVQDAENLTAGDMFSMQAWFFARDISTWRQLIAKDNEYLLRVDPPQEGNMMSAFVNTGSWEPRASASVPELETWIHFAATYDGDQLKVYVNGTLSGQSSRPGGVPATKNPLEFGRWGGALIGEDIGYFVGIIDEVAIFSDVLTETEIAEAMIGLQRFRVSVEVSGRLATTWAWVKLASSAAN